VLRKSLCDSMPNLIDLNQLEIVKRQVLISFWFCPNDSVQLLKTTGSLATDMDIGRGLKINAVGLENLVAIRKLPANDLEKAKDVLNVCFQLVGSTTLPITLVSCPQCSYRGIAPRVPIGVLPGYRADHRLIKSLLDESGRMASQEAQGQQGFRRTGFFLWFIILSLLPLLAVILMIILQILHQILIY